MAELEAIRAVPTEKVALANWLISGRVPNDYPPKKAPRRETITVDRDNLLILLSEVERLRDVVDELQEACAVKDRELASWAADLDGWDG